jgi:hypothetical protein
MNNNKIMKSRSSVEMERSLSYNYNYNNRDEAMSQSGFKTNGDIIRKVIIYSECKSYVYLYNYCDIYKIIIVILLFINLFFTIIVIIIEIKR